MFNTVKHKGVLIHCRAFPGEKPEYKTPIDRIGTVHATFRACQLSITKRLALPVTAHRNPTAGEIKRGYGATHHRDFVLGDFWDYTEHRLKSQINADDGIIYSRG